MLSYPYMGAKWSEKHLSLPNHTLKFNFHITGNVRLFKTRYDAILFVATSLDSITAAIVELNSPTQHLSRRL